MKAEPVAESTLGQIIYCRYGQVYHLEFGNIHTPLMVEQLYDFWESVSSIDTNYFEWRNDQSAYRRKIMIPIENAKVSMLFSSHEIIELRELLSCALDWAVVPEEMRA